MATTENEENVTDVKNVEMSRTMEPEDKLPLEELAEYKIYDDGGNGYWFGDMHKSKKAVFIFIRHFLCFAAKEYVEDLAMIPKNYLDESNVRLVVIGCGPWKYIEPFRQATGYQGFMFVDESRELYKKLGLFDSMKPRLDGIATKESKHVKSGFLMGTLKSMVRGMYYHEHQGDYHQQGGSFIIGPGPVVHYINRDRNPTDHTPINNLLGIAGAQQVNFPNDKRIMSI